MLGNISPRSTYSVVDVVHLGCGWLFGLIDGVECWYVCHRIRSLDGLIYKHPIRYPSRSLESNLLLNLLLPATLYYREPTIPAAVSNRRLSRGSDDQFLD